MTGSSELSRRARGAALDDAALLRGAGEDARARIDRLALPLQAIHGDAHLNNVVSGPGGPLWNDWEGCFVGPRAWDLGCLLGAAALFGRDGTGRGGSRRLRAGRWRRRAARAVPRRAPLPGDGVERRDGA